MSRVDTGWLSQADAVSNLPSFQRNPVHTFSGNWIQFAAFRARPQCTRSTCSTVGIQDWGGTSPAAGLNPWRTTSVRLPTDAPNGDGM